MLSKIKTNGVIDPKKILERRHEIGNERDKAIKNFDSNYNENRHMGIGSKDGILGTLSHALNSWSQGNDATSSANTATEFDMMRNQRRLYIEKMATESFEIFKKSKGENIDLLGRIKAQENRSYYFNPETPPKAREPMFGEFSNFEIEHLVNHFYYLAEQEHLAIPIVVPPEAL